MPFKTLQKVIVNELRLSNCGFDHDTVDSFVRSQWQSKAKNAYYLIYRWLVAVVLVATVIISLYSHLQESSFSLFFIYLTRWGIILNMIVGILGAVLVTNWHIGYHETILYNKKTPTSFKIYWALHNIALVSAFVITIVYWTILHDSKKGLTLAGVMSHAMNSVIMFIDILIAAYPMRLYHVIQPICFGTCFAVFSYIYHLCGGVNQQGEHFIYPVLNWATPKKALTYFAAINVLLIIVHTVLFCIYKLRVFIQRKLFITKFAIPQTMDLNCSITVD
ncbi:protein rolling stone-like [Sitodiplosis mosellana]|uniref:protein rolling stone-like n=1 Tax=Sitodiplosis mosellana TaxID=263140 RepID=UPI002444D3B1|nr:protein rolling stone-like [Sitodiplosis mosellana]